MNGLQKIFGLHMLLVLPGFSSNISECMLIFHRFNPYSKSVFLYFQLLGYIGHTSPECILEPGLPLNIEAPIPEGLSESAEADVTDMVVEQRKEELEFYQQQLHDQR